MSNSAHLKVYLFDEAPAEYKRLSRHGGDEDFVVVGPAKWFDGAAPFGFLCGDWVPCWGKADVHLKGETLVVIFAHA